MPNWCQNHVTITHPNPERARELVAALETGTFCEAVIPTPEIVDAYFHVDYWGTKWDVQADPHDITMGDGTTFTARFDSAWAPPLGVYATLAEEGADIDATFCELGIGFVGRWTPKYGEQMIDVHDHTADTIRAVAGDLLTDRYELEDELREMQRDNDGPSPDRL